VAEAVQAEAGQVPPGWPQLRWLAGGLWLVTADSHPIRVIQPPLPVTGPADVASRPGLMPAVGAVDERVMVVS
jgi:hypothetical protein